MTKNSIIAMLISAGMFAASSAYADHNSVWGAGSANMPNDIHNTRIEDDNETFLELVQQGGGADSVNRYADSDTTTTTMGSRSRMTTSMGSRSATMSRGGRR
ncbi:MAG: hypothetical protein PVJ63_05810 [Thioalkalispiraceae bacterium]|jgi:hypothetical protein